MADGLEYEYPVVNQMVANIESESGNTNEADRLLSEAIQVCPTKSSLYEDRSSNNIKRNYGDKAIEDAAKAISLATNK